jgi:Domain of unknown function (DUF5615)
VKKLLLDECVPRKFKQHLLGHECVTVPEAGLAGKSNGELLSLAESAGYHVFLTLDQGIPYEQNLNRRRIAVVLIHAKSNRLENLLPLISKILRLIEVIELGQLVQVP